MEKSRRYESDVTVVGDGEEGMGWDRMEEQDERN